MPNYSDEQKRQMTGAAIAPGEMANPMVEQLMNAMRQGGGGRGSNYGRQMSQRPQPGTIRNISNATPQFGPGGTSTPRYAGQRATGVGGLSGGQEMELQQNGYTDIGDVRYILDRSTGQVTQMPRPGSGYGGGPFWDRQGGPPSDYGAQTPVSLMDAIRRGR